MVNNAIMLSVVSFCSQKVNWNEKVALILEKKMANKFFMSQDPSTHASINKIFQFRSEQSLNVKSFVKGDNKFMLMQNEVSLCSRIVLKKQYITEICVLSQGARYNDAINRMIERSDGDIKRWMPELRTYLKSGVNTSE